MTTFTAAGKLIVPGAASTNAGGTFKAAGSNASSIYDGAAAFAAGGHFVAAGVGTVVGSSTHTGGGTFHAFCQITIDGGSTFDGGGSFRAFGQGTPPVINGSATFDGGGTFQVVLITGLTDIYSDIYSDIYGLFISRPISVSAHGASLRWTAILIRPRSAEPVLKWIGVNAASRVAVRSGTGGYAGAYPGGYGGVYV